MFTWLDGPFSSPVRVSMMLSTVELGSGVSELATTVFILTSIICCSGSAIITESATGTTVGFLSASAFSIANLRRYSSAIENGYYHLLEHSEFVLREGLADTFFERNIF